MQSRDFQTARVPDTICPGCKALLDAVTGRCNPEPDDLTICLDCGYLLTLDKDLRARPVSSDEEAALPVENRVQISALRRRMSSIGRPA